MKLMIMCLFFPFTSAHVTAKNDGQTKGPLPGFPAGHPEKRPLLEALLTANDISILFYFSLLLF